MQICSSRFREEPNLIAGGGFAYAILSPADQQQRGGYTQCVCQAFKIVQTEIPLAALNSAYVGTVQPALFGELFLTPAVQAAEITYIV